MSQKLSPEVQKVVVQHMADLEQELMIMMKDLERLIRKQDALRELLSEPTQASGEESP